MCREGAVVGCPELLATSASAASIGARHFPSGQRRHTYLALLRRNPAETGVRILGYCLMSNHVHLIAVPGRSDSLSVLRHRVHGRSCWRQTIYGPHWRTSSAIPCALTPAEAECTSDMTLLETKLDFIL
jgi:hypothetical protein